MAATNFDGERKGIVFGADIGFSPFTGRYHDGISETKTGTCLSGFAGWGVTRSLTLNLQGDMLYYDVATSSLSYQGFLGGSAHHFFKPDSLSPYLVVGVGMYVSHQAATWKTFTGPGGLISIGQEMNRHTRISLSMAVGKTEKVTHIQLSGNVGFIFY